MVKLRKPASSIFHHKKHTSQMHLWEKSPVESALVFAPDVHSPPLPFDSTRSNFALVKTCYPYSIQYTGLGGSDPTAIER